MAPRRAQEGRESRIRPARHRILKMVVMCPFGQYIPLPLFKRIASSFVSTTIISSPQGHSTLSSPFGYSESTLRVKFGPCSKTTVFTHIISFTPSLLKDLKHLANPLPPSQHRVRRPDASIFSTALPCFLLRIVNFD